MRIRRLATWRAATMAVGIGAALAGCATHPVATVSQGAIDALVYSNYPLEQGIADLPPCLQKIPATELAKKKFVKISYRASSSEFRTFTVAEAPAAGYAQAGVHVEVIPGDCRKGDLATIIRPLYTHSAD